MKEALIIFVRKPELGKVKTRLAATLGDELALKIYTKLLLHTLKITMPIPCTKFVFYFDDIDEKDIWNNDGYIKRKQVEGDLGVKMKHAFEQVVSEGYNRICIIGSDCFELTTLTIQNALTSLKTNNIVIGPAKDGGYYLLGMDKVYNFIFEDKQWSTNNLMQETIESIREHELSYKLLEKLTDIDEEKDVPASIILSLQ